MIQEAEGISSVLLNIQGVLAHENTLKYKIIKSQSLKKLINHTVPGQNPE